MIAALYVDPLGPYPKMPGVDVWDEARDARLYNGPDPAVLHPPCGPWGRLRRLCKDQDPELAIRAVQQVRQVGGVLEHPLGSLLWDECGLPPPFRYSPQEDLYEQPADEWGGLTILVEQVSWGHPCRKPTLLYIVRADMGLVRRGWRIGGTPTHAIASRSRRGGLLAPSAAARRRTPPAFAEWLVQIAESSRGR